MILAGWPHEAIEFCFNFDFSITNRIVGELFMSPFVTLIYGDKLYLCYPNGFEVHNKSTYIKNYDKKSIAEDMGRSIEDVCEWDDYAVLIEEQQMVAT